MPIHDVGYRSWTGTKTPLHWRWWMISKSGVRLAAKSPWMKRILFAAWLPVLYWAIGFFFVEKAIEQDFSKPTMAEMSPVEKIKQLAQLEKPGDNLAPLAIEQALRSRFGQDKQMQQLADAFGSRKPERIRSEVWRWLLMVFFRYPQAIMIVFLVGSVAPALISRDIRSRAFLMYFSRPIGRLEYILGKLMIPGTFIMAVTTLPALALYLIAVLMSPDFSVVLSTWDIPVRILLATLGLVIPTASIALMLSSLTQESRYAGFAWFAIWVLGHGAYFAVRISSSIQLRTDPFSPEVINSPMVQGWSALSLYNCLGDVQSVIFGFASLQDVWPGVVVLTAVTAISLWILYRRVSASIQA